MPRRPLAPILIAMGIATWPRVGNLERERVTIGLLILLLAACGVSPTELGSVDPGPTDVVLTDVVVLASRDIETGLQNRGGPGSYQLAFFGILDPLAPCNGCDTMAPLGESDAVSVESGYEEGVTWDTPGFSHVRRVIVYSRPDNTAVWFETDRWEN